MYRVLNPEKYPFTVVIAILNCIILMKAFDDPLMILKGLIFSQSLIATGYCDVKTHEIPDLILLPVAAAGFINFQLLFSLEGLVSMSVLFYIIALFTHEEGLGGGDVKLAAATGFAIGPIANIAGVMFGSVLFLLVYFIFFRKKKTYAMAPWLGSGCFLAYVLLC